MNAGSILRIGLCNDVCCVNDRGGSSDCDHAPVSTVRSWFRLLWRGSFLYWTVIQSHWWRRCCRSTAGRDIRRFLTRPSVGGAWEFCLGAIESRICTRDGVASSGRSWNMMHMWLWNLWYVYWKIVQSKVFVIFVVLAVGVNWIVPMAQKPFCC